MKLHTIRLREFRRYAHEIEITDLAPGLNLFAGPNEAGKSTIAAALRAAFLERYKTSKVAGFAPYGLAGARPSIELEFDCGGRHYVLRKSFLSKARCELEIEGAERVAGEQAEDTLAQLLGFEYSGKGSSRPEHAGIPGLLWIQQGGSGNLDAMKHASMHLREALSRVSGELASVDGDRLLERVAAEKYELLDSRGKPRGVYREAEERLALARAEHERCWNAHKAFEQALDRLNALKQAQAIDDRERPWLDFERKVAEARARQHAISQERDALERLLRERRQIDGTITLLLEQVARDQTDAEEARRLAETLTATRQAAEAADQALTLSMQRENQVKQALENATRQFEAARLAAERRDVTALLERQSAETQRLETALDQARRLAQTETHLRTTLAGMPMESAELDDLRRVSRRLEELRVQRNAVATRLRYALPSGQVMLNGEPMTGTGERLLTGLTTLELTNGGSLTIEPGGSDLALLAEEEAGLQKQQCQLLQRLRVTDVAEAEGRWVQRQRLQQEAEGARREMVIHAPQGMDALEHTLHEARALLRRLQDRLEVLGVAESPPLDRDPTALHAECKALQRDLEQAAATVTERRRQVQALTAEAGQVQARLHTLRQQLDADESRTRTAERNRRLAEYRSERADLERRILESEASIAQHRPDIVDQDIERFERSARIAHEAYQSRQREMLVLQGRLDEAGAQGSGESLATAEALLEHWTRRSEGLCKRAQALEMLHSLLQQQRDAATQKLLSPLAQRLTHYLQLLFPGASLQIDESLTPGALMRAGGSNDLADLSFGTQEQLGILLRFAYADLLKAAGRPTLLILDDALVHTDGQRREWMKRALFDAASRHQILMFTCHPDAWRDLGVPQRSLPG